MTSHPTSTVHRPLSSPAKAMLIVTASTTILLCYLFSTLATLLLLLLLGVEALMMIVGARFGVAFFFANLLKLHAPLLGLCVRSFWLERGTDYRIVLPRTDAPRLFALLDQLAQQLSIRVPNEVAIEMNAGAWVQLRGYRRGAGRTTLGLGYDLLASLSQSEVEAVLAHEMAHAKLVQRGLKSWLNKGVNRSAVLTGRLGERREAIRAAKQSSAVTSTLLRGSELLTRTAAQVVAAYSRQDEFEADRGAAQLCGSGPLRTALQRLEAMEEKLAHMPWRERVAQLELEGSFSAWLMEELKVPLSAPAPDGTAHARDPYSTHPALPDRIAALPPDDGRARNDAPGMELLADPDRVARELMHEIQRVVALQEQKDTKSLGRWARKTQRTSRIRWQQLPGMVLVTVGIIISILSLMDGFWAGHAIAAAFIVGGVFAYRRGRFRDRQMLPVPRFAQLKKAWEAEPPADLAARENALEAEIKSLVAAQQKSRQKVATLIGIAHAALAECDYLRAHVAARLAVNIKGKSVDAALALSVASGGLGLTEQTGSLLQFLVQHTGLGSQSTRWGAAWTLLLLGDWNAAEALLWQVHEKEPAEPTFLCLLALAQARRNKLQSAVMNAQRAIPLMPGDAEPVKLLTGVLLDAGRLREAGEQLATLRAISTADPEVAMMNVRWHLARREFDHAVQWVETVSRADPTPVSQLRLAEAFESARRDDTAAQMYERVLSVDFYPEAHLGLARLAARRHDKTGARQQLCAALNFDKAVGVRGTGPGPLFHTILNHLILLEEPREHCEAWIVNLPPDFAVKALSGRALLVYAPSQRDAERHFAALVTAIRPAAAALLSDDLAWQRAPKPQQPERPVRPGVQGVL